MCSILVFISSIYIIRFPVFFILRFYKTAFSLLLSSLLCLFYHPSFLSRCHSCYSFICFLNILPFSVISIYFPYLLLFNHSTQNYAPPTLHSLTYFIFLHLFLLPNYLFFPSYCFVKLSFTYLLFISLS